MSVVRRAALRFVELPGRAAADPFAGTGGDCSARVVRLRRSPGRRAHLHPLSEELVFVAAGRGVVWIDGELHPASAGDLVRIPPGTPHATVPDEGVEMELVCFFPHPDLAANLEETEIVVTEPEEET